MVIAKYVNTDSIVNQPDKTRTICPSKIDDYGTSLTSYRLSLHRFQVSVSLSECICTLFTKMPVLKIIGKFEMLKILLKQKITGF